MWRKTDTLRTIYLEKGYSSEIGTDGRAEILKHLEYLRCDNSQGKYNSAKNEWIKCFEDMKKAGMSLQLVSQQIFTWVD